MRWRGQGKGEQAVKWEYDTECGGESLKKRIKTVRGIARNRHRECKKSSQDLDQGKEPCIEHVPSWRWLFEPSKSFIQISIMNNFPQFKEKISLFLVIIKEFFYRIHILLYIFSLLPIISSLGKVFSYSYQTKNPAT